jgi:hypothetical protein
VVRNNLEVSVQFVTVLTAVVAVEIPCADKDRRHSAFSNSTSHSSSCGA